MTDRHDLFTEEPEESFPLQPALQTLWAYRRAMGVALGAVIALFVVAILVAYLVAPKERLASQGFQLTFDGAEQDRFPNGMRFSTADIVSTPVLSEVYRINDLARYLTFSDFKDSVFVLQANPDLELLSYEYQTKLVDTRLTPVERGRLEEEFRRKRDSLKSAQYSLNLRVTEYALRIPTELMAKTLQDTLSTWAQQAADRKGAIRYTIPVLSKNVMAKEFLTAEDYSIAVDILRSKTERVLRNISEIAELPGASAARIGDDQISLAEVRVRLEDVLRFKLEPLSGRIRASGLSRDPAAIERYFDSRLFQVQLEREEVAQRVKALQDAQRAYFQKGGMPATEPGGAPAASSVTPQLGESFIDRLLELSSESTDLVYRQRLTDRIITEGVRLADLSKQVQYYESMKRSFSGPHRGPDPAIAQEVTAATDQAFHSISAAMDLVGELYKRIAEQNLNPAGVLYANTTPFLDRTTASLTLRTALFYFVATLFVALILIPLSALSHAYFRQSISPRSVAPAAAPEKPASRMASV